LRYMANEAVLQWSAAERLQRVQLKLQVLCRKNFCSDHNADQRSMRKLARRTGLFSWNRLVWQLVAHCRAVEHCHGCRRTESTSIAKAAVRAVQAQFACLSWVSAGPARRKELLETELTCKVCNPNVPVEASVML